MHEAVLPGSGVHQTKPFLPTLSFSFLLEVSLPRRTPIPDPGTPFLSSDGRLNLMHVRGSRSEYRRRNYWRVTSMPAKLIRLIPQSRTLETTPPAHMVNLGP